MTQAIVSEELFKDEQDTAQTVQTGPDSIVGVEGQDPPPAKRRVRGPSEPYFELAWSRAEAKFRFCLWSANGRMLMTSALGYDKKKEAITAINAVAKAAPLAKKIVETPDTPEGP